MRLYVRLVIKMEFERLDRLVEKTVREFEGIYRAYNIDLLSYEEVLGYIDDNPIIKDLFIKYILEKTKFELENFDLSDHVNLKGIFNPFYKKIDELIDDFMDWLKYRYLHGDINAKTQL